MVDEADAADTGSGEDKAIDGSPYAARPYARTLGTVSIVLADDTVVSLSPAQQAILTRLALAAPHPQAWGELADAVWPHGRPASARAAIQNQISRLRAAAGDGVITTSGDGYLLGIDTDITLLRTITVVAQQALAPAPVWNKRPGLPRETTGPEASLRSAALADAAFQALDRMLTTTPPDDAASLDGADEITLYRRHARTVIAAAHTVRLTAALRAGRWAWALIEAEQRHSSSPLDEQISADYARALALAGRRTEALSLVARVRRELRLHRGVDSGPHLDTAEREILHDQIAAPVDRRETSRSTIAPLIGRSDELRAILQAVAQRHPVQVHGEHGSGVSRILFETRAQLTALGVCAILVRAEENPHSATSLIEELLAELGAPIEMPDNPIAAFESAAAAITAQTPTVVLIDDVHFLGPSAWQAIRSMSDAGYGGLVLGGHGHIVRLDDQVEVALGPLDDDAVAAMAGQRWSDDPAATAEIVAASGGNPLAVRLIASGIPRTETGGDGATGDGTSPYPSGLDAFIDQLIGDRDSDRLHDLHLAAVAGDGYPVAAFEHLDWPHPPRPPADLIDIDVTLGTIRFRHGAVQNRAYRMVPRGVQLDMHYALGMAARAVGAAAGTVARHLVAATELDPRAAVLAAREAARAATTLGAHADAAEWLRQARAIVKQYGTELTADQHGDAARIQLDVEYGDALRLAGHPDHMPVLTAAAHDALAAGDDGLIAAAGFALLQLGGSSQAGSRDDDLTALVDDVINSIHEAEIRAPVQAAASLAWSLSGHAAQARALFDAAEAAARHPDTRRTVLPFAYLALGLPGDLPRRHALADELMGLAEAAGDPVAMWEGHQLRLSSAIQLGDGVTARAALTEMEVLAEQTGDVGRRWCTLYCAATIAHIGGDADRAEELAGQAYHTFVRISPERAAAAYYSQLLPLRREQGRLPELQPIISRLVVEQPGVTGWHAAAALILAAGDPDAERQHTARQHAAAALRLAQTDFTWLAAHVIGGRAAALLDDRELAERYLEQLDPWADLVCWQGTCSYGPVAEVLAMLYRTVGDETSAAGAARRAEELHASLAGDGR